MTRRLAPLLFVTVLAFPAAAGAATKRVSVPVPADGDVSFAQFRVTTKSPDGATIRNARRLGDLRVEVEGRRIGRRAHLVSVLVLNPRSRASAAQDQLPRPQILFHSFVGPIGARPVGVVKDVLTRAPSVREGEVVSRTCTRRTRGRPSFRGRHRFLRRDRATFGFLTFGCQSGSTRRKLANRTALERLGADVPACMGTAEQGDNANQVTAQMVCTQPTNVIALRGATGNQALTCVAPPGSFCACGPFCSPLPVESACFSDGNGFDRETLLEFRASFEAAANPKDVLAIWVPQGSPVTAGRYAYLRYVVDTP
jgi:hypothetical protein